MDKFASSHNSGIDIDQGALRLRDKWFVAMSPMVTTPLIVGTFLFSRRYTPHLTHRLVFGAVGLSILHGFGTMLMTVTPGSVPRQGKDDDSLV